VLAFAFKPEHDKIFTMEEKTVAKNRKAKFEFFILETLEAGISLVGSEIKSIRASQVSLEEAYIKVDGHEAWLMDAHIAPYVLANRFNHEPRRSRRLLLHKKEILELWNEVRQKGVTIIPVRLYIKDGRAKVEIAVAKGKHLYDKRADLAKKDMQREMDRKLKDY
jgi:SsrA-binding protein